MYFVYVLQSEVNQSLYIGYTENVFKRLAEHNGGKSKSQVLLYRTNLFSMRLLRTKRMQKLEKHI